MIATSGSDSVIRVWHLGCDLKDCTALPVKAAPVTSRKKIRKAKENAKKIAEKETVERNAERKMKAYESGAEERESQRLQEVAKKLECSPVKEIYGLLTFGSEFHNSISSSSRKKRSCHNIGSS